MSESVEAEAEGEWGLEMDRRRWIGSDWIGLDWSDGKGNGDVWALNLCEGVFFGVSWLVGWPVNSAPQCCICPPQKRGKKGALPCAAVTPPFYLLHFTFFLLFLSFLFILPKHSQKQMG